MVNVELTRNLPKNIRTGMQFPSPLSRNLATFLRTFLIIIGRLQDPSPTRKYTPPLSRTRPRKKLAGYQEKVTRPSDHDAVLVLNVIEISGISSGSGSDTNPIRVDLVISKNNIQNPGNVIFHRNNEGAGVIMQRVSLAYNPGGNTPTDSAYIMSTPGTSDFIFVELIKNTPAPVPPAPVADMLRGLLAAGVLLRRRK